MSQHIDWRDVAMKALLADGKVDEPEVALLKKALKSSEGTWFQEGVVFLRDLRAAYTKKAKAKKEDLSEAFENFFFKVVTENVLKDGEISDHEAKWLTETLFADGKIDDREWKFLQELNKKAKTKANAFITLYAEAEKKRNKGAAPAATTEKPAKSKGGGGKKKTEEAKPAEGAAP
jgi:hypothetical protein